MILSLLFFPTMQVHAYNDSPHSDIYSLYQNFDIHLKQYAYNQCRQNNLSYSMFLAVAYNESRFQSDAIHVNQNGSIDRGLCQINDACFDFLNNKGILNSKEELFNPYTNIDCYIALMKYHKNYTNDDSKALLRYQVGEGKYRRKYDEGQHTNKTHQQVMELESYYRTYLNSLSAIFELKNIVTTPYLLRDYPELNRLLLFKIYDTHNTLI